MSLSQEDADMLNNYRQRIAAGEDIPREELAAAVVKLREQRAAVTTSPKAPSAAKKSTLPSDLGDLFS